MNEKAAILNFVGQMYGQMKEIDTNIASAGSGAKFGGRSVELERAFKQIAATPLEAITAPVELPPVEQPQMLTMVPETPITQQKPMAMPSVSIATISEHVVPAKPLVSTDQLEFNFKEDANSILKDIYNVLYDIRKLLNDQVAKKNAQPTQAPQIKKPKKPALLQCCLCGGKPKGEQTDAKIFEYKCTSCGNVSSGANEPMAKIAWNSQNEQV